LGLLYIGLSEAAEIRKGWLYNAVSFFGWHGGPENRVGVAPTNEDLTPYDDSTRVQTEALDILGPSNPNEQAYAIEQCLRGNKELFPAIVRAIAKPLGVNLPSSL